MPTIDAPSAPAATPFPPAKTLVRCIRHRERDALVQCERCRRHWCSACVKTGGERGVVFHLCACGGRGLGVVVPTAVPRRTAGERLADSFAYPFRGEGRWLLLLGTFVYGSLDLFWGNLARASFTLLYGMFNEEERNVSRLGAFSLVSSFAVVAVIGGYQLAQVMQIIRDSAKGKNESPGFPEFATFFESIALPFLRVASLVALTLGPGVVVAAFGGFVRLFGVALFLAGAAVLPMALTSVAIAGSLEGLDVRRILGAIRIAGLPYFFAATLFVAVIGLLSIGAPWLEQCPGAGPFACAFLMLYLCAVAGRVLGTTYAEHAAELQWN